MLSKIIGLSILSLTLLACAQASSQETVRHSPGDPHAVITSELIALENFSVTPRQENNSPIGASPDPNRNIGFADVFLDLTNSTENNMSITIESLEIRNTQSNDVEMQLASSEELSLGPLQPLNHVFNLKKKAGYSELDVVKAVMTYRINNGPIVSLESASTGIEMY